MHLRCVVFSCARHGSFADELAWRQIETSVVSYLLELVDEADKNRDGKIDFDEWEIMGMFVSFR